VPKAEIPKEHLRAIDKDHQVHDFQIVCSTRCSLIEVFLSVRAACKSRDLWPFANCFSSSSSMMSHFSLASVLVYTKLGPKGFRVVPAPFDARHPGLRRPNRAGSILGNRPVGHEIGCVAADPVDQTVQRRADVKRNNRKKKAMTTHPRQTAPTQFVEASGIRYAYRRFGKAGGVPLASARPFYLLEQ
jgi:hypothetical protein